MNPSRIAELLEPFLEPIAGNRLSDAELAKISAYLDLLLYWNARVNLTAVRDPEEIVTRHFGESLFAAKHLLRGPIRTNIDGRRVHLADVGSGAGFPGVPMKIWAPAISLTLIESKQKKAVFLREVCRALWLTDVNVQNVRAEEIAAEAFDIVTLRAVERFLEVLPAAAKLVRPSGRLALLISSSQVDAAQGIIGDFRWDVPNPIPLSESRQLLIGTREP